MGDSSVSRLISPEKAAELDKEASDSWGLSPFALVEAAGRSCAAALENELKANSTYSGCINGPVLVCAGAGNNGADALVMLRILRNKPCKAAALLSRYPASDETTPRAAAVKALLAMGVPVIAWNGEENQAELFRDASLIIDGIAGTGIHGALEAVPLEMLNAINKHKKLNSCCVVSVDVPSGAGSAWKPGYPVVKADCTLAVEPLKTVLYTPALRPYCGKIIPVTEVFPAQLIERYGDAELLCWETQSKLIPRVASDAYKYRRGLVEIHAGKKGTSGAARIAAAGASAAGAGLVRLVIDDDIYPALASSLGGIMAVPASSIKDGDRFNPTALLLGSGWGRGEERLPILRQAIEAESEGVPLVLDADGIYLFKRFIMADENPVFHGRAILTPHAGELETLSGMPKEELLSQPSLILEIAKKLNAVIIFKSHVMVIAAPDGRLGFVDGMDPSLGAGGSGDLLAGLCAGIASRVYAGEKSTFDPYAVAAAAGTLLIEASGHMGRRFYDPVELAKPASVLAGEAWLSRL